MRGQTDNQTAWASHALPYSSDSGTAPSQGDVFVFGAFVVFVSHDLRRVEVRCMSGNTIKAMR